MWWGWQSSFDIAVLLLKQQYAWQHVYYLQRNVTQNRPRRQDVHPDTIALIEEQEALDIALYAFAQRLVATQIASQPTAFTDTIRRFQFTNDHLMRPILKLEHRARQKPIYHKTRHQFRVLQEKIRRFSLSQILRS